MRLLYAPLVSERAVRIETGRACWCRNGRRKEDNEVSGNDGLACTCRENSGIRGGILARLVADLPVEHDVADTVMLSIQLSFKNHPLLTIYY
jgi:hypothetical protein